MIVPCFLVSPTMASDPLASSSSGLFPVTAWTFIRNAQQLDRDQYVAARNEFLARYWKPVFCFLRARGYPPGEAEELTQAFFERFLEKDSFRRAEQARGRFRTFLLAVLGRLLSDLHNWERLPHQEQFERQWVSISTLMKDEDRSFEPPCHETPEAVFMKQWAVALVRSIQEQLKRRCEDAGKPKYYAIFAARFIEADSDIHVTREALAEQFGLTLDQVRYALDQTRDWFAELLRAEVRQHVTSDEEVGQEIRDLMDLLGGELYRD
jgi:DNA-directed RNA polymerase specialized sigma24 family protein